MKNNKGFTFAEMMIVFAIVVILASIIGRSLLDNRGATEKRAFSSARNFIERNSVDIDRLTCAGDSDGDGYGTCNVTTKDGEKIVLECPTGFVSTKIFGASECKEVFLNYNIAVGQK